MMAWPYILFFDYHGEHIYGEHKLVQVDQKVWGQSLAEIKCGCVGEI